MLQKLIQLFIRSHGRKPNSLEMILLKQKATKQAVDERKIVSMVDRQPVNPNKPILGGKNVPETESEILKRIKNQNKEAVKNWPEKKAYGGIAGMLGEPTYADENHRVPYKDAKLVKGSKMSRRGFLKIMGGLAALPVVGKLFKFAKPLAKSSKVLTSVPIKSGADGMPLWFKPLVNKVIAQGDDVSKKFATQERQIVHKTKLPDSQTDVIVTQDLNTGNVSVELGMTKHGFPDGHLGQPVRLEYKAAEDIMTGPDMDDMHKIGVRDPHVKTKTKTKEEFWVEEAEFTGGHPENIKFEESTIEKFGDHGSNFDEVEMFATGKVKKTKPTKKAERTEYESGKAEADAEAYWEEHGDFASGGRVPLSMGSGKLEEAIRAYRKYQGSRKNPRLNFQRFFEIYAKENFATGGRVPLHEGGEVIDIDWDDWDPYDYQKFLWSLGVEKAEGGRVPLAGGAIVKGGKWFIKSLTDTRKQLKTMRLSPGQLKQYLDQIDDQIRRIKAGEKIPDEIIQTIRKDPKFKSVWQNQLSADPELREMEEVLLEYGQKHASGGLAGMLGE